MNKSILCFIIIALISTTIIAQTTIDNITKNPGRYDGDVVNVEGLVIQYVESQTTTSYYLLKSDYGAIIKVNTAEGSPVTNKKYKVRGIVYIDQLTRTAFISEKSRALLKETASSQQNPPTGSSNDSSDVRDDNTITYIIIASAIMIIGLLIFAMTRNRKTQKADEFSKSNYQAQQMPSSGGGNKTGSNDATTKINSEQEVSTSSSDDFKTIKITTSAPKTLKFIPGKLVITNGEDKGKEFKIAGYPTPEGSIVSIGREEIKGERSYSHIQLLQKTISRKQAEIISTGGKLYVKNLSETNLTQVDGIEIQPNQKTELKPNSTIMTGEVEFKYTV